MKTDNDLALSWCEHTQGINVLYDPEVMTFEEQRKALALVYQYCYPWHGTDQARAYDYPTFEEAVKMWAGDDFYRQHMLAKCYCETLDFIGG